MAAILFLFCFFHLCLKSSCDGIFSLEETYYTQVLDHFKIGSLYNNVTFSQRYFILDKDWTKFNKKGPILVCFGGEGSIEYQFNAGLMEVASDRFQGLQVYIEHRFYGKSIPFGSTKKALASPAIRSFLNVDQAMEDFAQIILSIKKDYSAPNSPIIVLGLSYSAILAAWFRLRYPDIAIGAVASSAPIVYSKSPPKDDFCTIVERDFEHINEMCSDLIRQSWGMMDEIGSSREGLHVLTKLFDLCRPLRSTFELKRYLAHIYSYAARNNRPSNNLISEVCDSIVGAPNNDTIKGIAAATAVARGSQSCGGVDIFVDALSLHNFSNNDEETWNWQLCGEMFIHKSCTRHNSMIPRQALNDRHNFRKRCLERYGSLPRPWTSTNCIRVDQFKATSNIIFSNGLMDPYSSLGILEDISDTIVAINTEKGSHSIDMTLVREDDPKWLVDQREKEMTIMEKWINRAPSKTFFLLKLLSFFLLLLSAFIYLYYSFK